MEKPETFVSNMINCGVYVLGVGVLDHIKVSYDNVNEEDISHFVMLCILKLNSWDYYNSLFKCILLE